MIANVQCLLPARLHKTRHVQLRMATRQHLSNQANQVGVCFVLNEYSDDPNTSAYMYGQNVPLSTEPTQQTPLTPTASNAVDIKKHNYFQRSCHGRQRQTMDDPKPTTGQDGTNRPRSGTYRGMLYVFFFFCMIFGNCRQDTHSQDTSVQYSLITARTVHSMRLAQDQA